MTPRARGTLARAPLLRRSGPLLALRAPCLLLKGCAWGTALRHRAVPALRFVVSACSGTHTALAVARRSRAHAHVTPSTRLRLFRAFVVHREAARAPQVTRAAARFAPGRGPLRTEAGVRHPSAYLSNHRVKARGKLWRSRPSSDALPLRAFAAGPNETSRLLPPPHSPAACGWRARQS